MNQVLTAIARWQAHFKSVAFADMHRMASGMSGVDLPRASAEKRSGHPKGYLLKLSLKRRQHLALHRYLCGGSH